MYVDGTTLYLQFLAQQLDYLPSVHAQCITCVTETGPIAGVLYDTYNGVTIAAHIWIKKGAVPSRYWYAAIFDYPFNRLNISKLVGHVAGSNAAAMELDRHFGFIEEARIKDYSPQGDLVLYTMTRDQCRILNSPAWAKSVESVRRVA